MSHVVEYLPSRHETLSSNTVLLINKKKFILDDIGLIEVITVKLWLFTLEAKFFITISGNLSHNY